MADVILFQRIYHSLRIDHQKKIYFTLNKQNNIRNTVRVSMFQKLLANKHLCSRDSRISLIRPSGGLGVSTWQQKKQDLICHVAKVKFATSTHSIADVILFRLIFYSLQIESFQNTKRKYILHIIKKTIFVILSVYACFKSFRGINISGCVIHGYLWYGRVEI